MRPLPADRRRQIPGDHDVRAVRQVAAFRRPLSRPMAAHVREPSRRAHRLDQQIPMLGGGRSGEMGAGRLCLHPRRQPRRGSLARRDRHLVAARSARRRVLYRVGRHAALVERQGRPQRHFLLRADPMQAFGAEAKHLAAICIWEGAADFYRDMAHHGGIFNRGFVQDWSKAQVYSVQNGRGRRGFKSRMNGDWVSGPETLPDEQLGRNRRDFYEDCISRKLDTDPYWQSRMPDCTKVKTPLLSAANWGGQGLHPRGNFEGFVRAASEQKWLEVHGIEHWTHFYTNYGLGLQKKFFGHFLKGEDTGWSKQPKVLLQVRHPGEKFVERHENEWPLARTQWTRFYIDPE